MKNVTFHPICFFLLISSVSLSAQTESTISDTTQAISHVKQSDAKLFIDKIEVEGQLEKPQAVFILPGQTPAIDDIQIERSFLNEIFRPIEKKHTIETKYKPEYLKKRKDVIEW
ncbi:hypothetical protein EH223_11750 [candidate division KSB1 bacterium]|nr:hypothetical protein [candidate division KSB1 bacterium]RQW02676.1 MAG: hypothetical protein EH223_11750 [candidate division KSB1 bacterium]